MQYGDKPHTDQPDWMTLATGIGLGVALSASLALLALWLR